MCLEINFAKVIQYLLIFTMLSLITQIEAMCSSSNVHRFVCIKYCYRHHRLYSVHDCSVMYKSCLHVYGLFNNTVMVNGCMFLVCYFMVW